MKVERVHDIEAPDGHNVPAVLFAPEKPQSGVLVLSSYGATKEQMFGMGFVLAEHGLAALCIDTCGHGDNQAPIGRVMINEVEAGLGWLRQQFTSVGATGLSIGGRLALMSSADYMAAISPSVVTEISPQGRWMFENFPSPGVREPYSGYVVQLLAELGPVPANDRPCLLLYAERDIPMIMAGAKDLQALLPRAEVRYVKSDIRPDVSHENGFIRYLPRWFNHTELKFNTECVEVTAKWLAARVATAAGAQTSKASS